MAEPKFIITASPEEDWQKRVAQAFEGRKIVRVRWMTVEEASDFGLSARPCVFYLDDGTNFFPMSDDEGNNGGALSTSLEDLPTVPVF